MVCRYCGVEFEPKKRGRTNTGFCNKKCADNWRHHNVYNLRPKKYTRQCELCGQWFETNRPDQKYCSASCSSKVTIAAYHSKKTCDVCGKTFESTHIGEIHCPECSAQLGRDRQNNMRRRRRRLIGDTKKCKVRLSKVNEAAGGICQICGLPVPAGVDCNDEWSATIDHVIPVSEHGPHTYANCQLAHRICNSSKGNHGVGWRIDWDKRLVEEPGVWDEKLKRLNNLLSAGVSN